jgi:hypothetical protein
LGYPEIPLHTSLELEGREKKSTEETNGTIKIFGSNALIWYLNEKISARAF